MTFQMSPGTKVEWIRGAVGLTGTVVGLIVLEGAEPEWRELVRVYTLKGDYYEAPKNLKVRRI